MSEVRNGQSLFNHSGEESTRASLAHHLAVLTYFSNLIFMNLDALSGESTMHHPNIRPISSVSE